MGFKQPRRTTLAMDFLQTENCVVHFAKHSILMCNYHTLQLHTVAKRCETRFASVHSFCTPRQHLPPSLQPQPHYKLVGIVHRGRLRLETKGFLFRRTTTGAYCVATLGSRLRAPRSDFFPTQLPVSDEIPMPTVARSVRRCLRQP